MPPAKGRSRRDKEASGAHAQSRLKHPYLVPPAVSQRLNLRGTGKGRNPTAREADTFSLATNVEADLNNDAEVLRRSIPGIARLNKDDKRTIRNMTTVIVFWKGKCEENDVIEYMDGTVPHASLNFQEVLKKVRNLNSNLQRNLFCPYPLREFVKEKVRERNHDPAEERYDDLTDAQKTTFWVERYDHVTAMDFGEPLSKALPIHSIKTHRVWGRMLQTYFVVACKNIWENRTRIIRGDGTITRKWARNSKSKNLEVDTAAVYASARAVPDTYFPNRPHISKVPVEGSLFSPRRRTVPAQLAEDLAPLRLRNEDEEESDTNEEESDIGEAD